MKTVRPPVVSFLSAMAIGILLFLLWDVLTAAVEPVEEALTEGNDGRFVWLAALLGGGFAVGLLSLGLYDGWLRKRRSMRLDAGAAASVAELSVERRALGSVVPLARDLHRDGDRPPQLLRRPRHRSVRRGGRDQPRHWLIIGFGLHNATEGFGIVAPLAGDDARPSWGFLAFSGSSAAVRRSSGRSSASVVNTAVSSPSSRSPPARSCTSSSS